MSLRSYLWRALTVAMVVVLVTAGSACNKKSRSRKPLDPLVVTTTSLPVGIVGSAYSTTLLATGGLVPYTWTLTAGAMPAGLTLAPTGEISGSPSTLGTSTLTFQVSDSVAPPNTDAVTLDLMVLDPLTITTTSLPDGAIGTPYSFTLTGTGGLLPYAWTLSAGTLQTGLALSPSGDITGTPTTSGAATLTFQLTDAALPQNIDSVTLDLTVFSNVPQVTIAPLSGPRRGMVDVIYDLVDADGDMVTIAADYSTNSGLTYQPAASGPGGEASGPIQASATPTVHLFQWDSSANIGTFVGTTVRVRLTPSDLQVGTSDETPDFAIDNRQGQSIFIPGNLLKDARKSHTATLLNDGRVLLAGGTGMGDVVLDSAEIYDPVTGGFRTLTATMTTPRTLHTASILPSGAVLLAGGYLTTSGPMLDSAEVFDPVAETFQLTGSMTAPRAGHAAVSTPTGAIVSGGNDVSSFPPSPLTGVETYDPVAGTFGAPPDNMAVGRGGHTATLLQSGRVLFVAGTLDQDVSYEEFDPGTGSSPVVGALVGWLEILAHRASLLPNGDVLVTGGGPSWLIISLSTSYSNAFLYSPGSGMTSVGPMFTARKLHTSTLLPDGRVLIAGGMENLGARGLPDAETYDTASPGWTILPAMTPRHSHTATLLVDGRVLIAGGTTSGADPVGSTDFFHP